MLTVLTLFLLQADVMIIRRTPPPPSGGANNIAYESSGSKVCSSGSETSAFDCTSNTFTTGWTVFVWCSGYNAQSSTSATDGTNTYNAIHASLSDGGNARGRLYRANNVTGGTYTITCNWSGGVFPSTIVRAYSGVATSSNDGSGTGTGSDTAPTPSTVATTNANDVLISCATSGNGSGTTTWTAPTDFINKLEQTNASVTSTSACADRLVTSTSTYGAVWTMGPSNGWVVALTAEKSN